MPKQYNLVIVDDDPVIQLGVCSWLQSSPNQQTTRCITRQMFYQSPESSLAPNELAIFKAQSFPLKDLAYFSSLSSMLTKSMCLLIGDIVDMQLIQDLFHIGIKGYLSTTASGWDIAYAFREVYQHNYYIDSRLGSHLMSHLLCQQKPSALSQSTNELTTRERELLYYLSQGFQNKEIAKKLNLAEATVRNYISNLYSKIQVAHRLEAIMFAYQHACSLEQVVVPLAEQKQSTSVIQTSNEYASDEGDKQRTCLQHEAKERGRKKTKTCPH